MKFQVVHRNPEDFSSLNSFEIQRYFRTRSLDVHPFHRQREYVRSLVATKLDKIFAKPLVWVFSGHRDSIQCISRSRIKLTDVFTGSADGEIRMWDLSANECFRAIKAHDGFVTGLCTNEDDQYLYSCGDDKKIKQWKLERNMDVMKIDMDVQNTEDNILNNGEMNINALIMPTNVFESKHILTSIDHHPAKPLFLSTGETVDFWDYNRSTAIQSFRWGIDPFICAKFNPAEPHLVATASRDNSVGLYDLRGNSALRKVILKMKSNAISWNPMQPMNFTVANEDHNLYSFDMRKLSVALIVHKDFTNSVLDVDYSPTGKEFVASSFDRSIRFFNYDAYKSRDVYHTKRMQIVQCCNFSGDGRYIFSGSADMCFRVWKAEASAPIGYRSFRERQALAYKDKLKEQYGHLKEIKRIARHRHVPILIKKTTEKKRIMEQAEKRREINRIKHSKSGSLQSKSEKAKHILRQVE